MSTKWTDKEMAKDFAHTLIEEYYDDLLSPGEWRVETGRCADLYPPLEEDERCDDYDENLSRYENWTYTYDYSSLYDCGRETCNEIACGFRHIAQITIDTGGGIKYRYSLDHHGDLEES